MKKSQILAALALAFALGVVAPVVSTTNTVSAFTAEDLKAKPAVQGSATQADVNNAVAAIEANITYKNMKTLSDVLDGFSADANGDVKYADLVASSTNSAHSKDAEKIVKALTDNFGLSSSDADKVYKDASFVAQVDKAVAYANDTEYLYILSPIFAAIDDKDDAAFRTALNNYNDALANKFTADNKALNADSSVKISDYIYGDVNKVESNFNAIAYANWADKSKSPWSCYYGLYKAVDAAETTEAKYTAGKTALVSALQNAGVLNQQGLEQLSIALKSDHVYLNGPAGVVGLANIANSYNNNLTAWESVETTVEAAKKGVINLDSNANYKLVIAMAQALKTAENNTTQTPAEIAATLVGYKAPAAQNTVSEGPVTVTGAFPADLKLSVVKSDKKVAAFGDAKYAMWDINLIDANQKVVTYNGSVMVTIEVPKDLDAAKSSVYFVTDEGKVEKLAARVENGKMVFTVSHFSLYAIVEDNGKNFGINAPDTGIVMNTEAGASTTVAMVAGVATALTAAGAGVVAYRNARRSTRK